MLRLQLHTLLVLILLLFSLKTGASPPHVYLKNSEWTVQIVPQTLAVKANPSNTVGLDIIDQTLTYILTNPFNNQIRFKTTSKSGLGMHISHAFTPNWEQGRYGFRISLSNASPVTPAKLYSQYLMENDEFISFMDKIEKTPEAEKLLGAAHVYLWGGKLLSQYDVTDWNKFAIKLLSDNKIAKQIW